MLELRLKHLYLVAMLTALVWPASAVERRHGILVGEVLRFDAAAKTMVIRLADGTEQTVHFTEQCAVHGTRDAAVAAADSFRGLKKGSEVAVHYSAEGTRETAEEIDNIGKDGLKATQVTVTHLDRGAKTLTAKAAGGAETTYRLSDSAARDAGKGISKGAAKSSKATLYYVEEGNRRIVHFFKRVI